MSRPTHARPSWERPRRRVGPLVLGLLGSAIVAGAVALLVSVPGRPGGISGQMGTPVPVTTVRPTPVPVPGHEVYGYLPYWEMDDGIADHLAATRLTTLALFSVTHGRGGALDREQNGYRRIDATAGRALVAAAHERGVRVELVLTSFGEAKNAAFFDDEVAQARTIQELVAFTTELGLDGINVDVELLDLFDVPAYGQFVEELRTDLRAADADGQVSVATTASERGAAMAAAASAAGADRIFLMGYDYHWSGSQPGASSPLARRDGSHKDLVWSLDLYAAAGVPVERTILGLPLYGMAWPVESPDLGATRTGRGEAWIPRRNLGVLADPSLAPTRDAIEVVEFIARPTGTAWEAIYFDSPPTLARKLTLADVRGLAGAGFWALGYERGLPDYTALIEQFHSGRLSEAAAALDPGG